MIGMLLALACHCSTDPPDLPVPTVDRSAVQGATCYRGDDGTLLELVVSASPRATGILTPSGGSAVPLAGRREGRTLDFRTMEVELLGRSVALTRDGERTLLQAAGCPGD